MSKRVHDQSMKKKIAITLGDPAGIGPEIVVKALLQHPAIYETTIPIVFGHRQLIERALRWTGLESDIREFDNPQQMDTGSTQSIYCIRFPELSQLPGPGIVSPEAGRPAFEYIRTAIQSAQQGWVDAVATAPIHKEALKLGGVPYLDHTEMFAKLTGSAQPMTLFVTGGLRIFFYSRHIPFRQIADHLDKERLVETLRQCNIHLKQIGIENPRMALAALNPHGGESGMFGSEEIDILIPAVAEARRSGLSVEGPVPADSVFHLARIGQFDAVLSLYHDQGHIAAKTFDFDHTVSLTMGLPFLRTSVDHGTAMDLAGKNRANEISMVEAIKAAAKYCW
jgi:4-phospho-D-threonate 3-dehydrogenase / 4-phospho-D-erythronate 3-dehydrogenase